MRYAIYSLMVFVLFSNLGCEALQRMAEEDARRREAESARRREEYRENYCSYNGAYVLGVNDGKERVDMRLNMAKSCDLADRAESERGYREGYAVGLKSAPPVPMMSRGNWDCAEDVRNRSGEIDYSRCREYDRRWACYHDVEKRCLERRTGQVESLREKRYTFCAESLSECW
jgi:hypothetical protein